MKTTQLSSNYTLYWRVFVPIFGTTVLTLFLLSFVFLPKEMLYLPFPAWIGAVILFVVWAIWLLFLRRTLLRLKRVDADETHLYVTNYWKTVRYPWEDVAQIEEKTRLGRRIINFILHAPGTFGQKISFLPGADYDPWRQTRP